MNLKEKLADAHNNFPIIESHPAMLYAEALNRIIELENELKESRRKAIEDFCVYLLKNWRIGLHDQRVAFFETDKSIEIQKNALR